MGTFASIEVGGLDEVRAASAIDGAFRVIAEIEAQMHPSRTGGDLARLNGALRGERVPVSDATFDVLALSQRLATASGGMFDPCLPDREGVIGDLEFGTDLSVLCHRPVSIDLGGIAKGYAVDRAVACLREHGADDALVDIGGDLRSFGDKGHVVGIRLPGGKILRHELRNSALAASDADEKHGPSEHRGYYTRGRSRTRSRNYAAVLATSAAIADALTKCALFCTGAEWLDLTQQFDAKLVES